MARILVTGATGFLGQTLVPKLALMHEVHAATRLAPSSCSGLRQVTWVHGPDLGPRADWGPLLVGMEAVVHLAAIAHVPVGATAEQLSRVQEVNALGTLSLASQAAAAGVSRFIFMSSVKALAERSGSRPLRPDDAPAPEDAYGRAKLAAELGLAQIQADTGLNIVTLRPPLIYGPRAKGNFALLVRVVRRGLPLPFASLTNRRSLLSVWNLADAICACLESSRASGATLHLADDRTVSTRELVELIAQGAGVGLRMFPVPPSILAAGFRAIGQRATSDRLLGTLELDTSLTRATLDWTPPLSLEEGIVRAVRDSR